MIVLGVDPGLSITGWGLVKKTGSNINLIGYGCIKTKPSIGLSDRLKILHSGLKDIIKNNNPEIMAIEELFFSKEARTIAAVSQARGAILLAAGQENLPVYEYNPRRVKIALTGYGSADKFQIQNMVKMLLSISEIPKPDDAADALAIAVCHLNTVVSVPRVHRTHGSEDKG